MSINVGATEECQHVMDKSIAVTRDRYLQFKIADKHDLQLCFIH